MRKRAELRPPEPRLSLADWGDAESVFQARRAALVPIHQPLVLISQIQRSGGTLLNSLLDGHPQLHVHPWEIQVGHPDKYRVAADRSRCRCRGLGPGPLRGLAVASLQVRVSEGSVRRSASRGGPAADDRALVRRSPVSIAVSTTTLRPPLAKSSTATSWRSSTPGSTARDSGRGPSGGWRASARGSRGERAAADGGATTPTAGWSRSCETPAAGTRRHDHISRATATSTSRSTNGEPVRTRSRAQSARRPTRSSSLTYERLVAEPEAVLGSLAAWLEIDWAPSLLEPSFNRHPVPANSSFEIPARGIRTESLKRWEVELDDAELARIEERALSAYESVCELADSA